MDTIRVIITGPAAEGGFPYQIEPKGTRLACEALGRAEKPLLDACWLLREMGVAEDDAVIGLYYPGAVLWHLRTTVGYGAKYAVLDSQTESRVVPPQLPQPPPPPVPRGTVGVFQATSAETPATSSEEPPKPRRRPKSQAGKDRAEPKPAKPKRSRRKPKPAKSGERPKRR